MFILIYVICIYIKFGLCYYRLLLYTIEFNPLQFNLIFCYFK